MFRAPFRAPFRGWVTTVDIEITAAIGEISVSGIVPSTTAGVSVTATATVGAASAQGASPIITAGISATTEPPVGFVDAEGIPAYVTTLEGIFVRPPPGEVDAEGVIPTVAATKNVSISTTAGEVHAEGFAPKVYTSTVVRPTMGEVAAEGIVPAVKTTQNVVIKTPVGKVAAEGFPVDINVSRPVYIHPTIGEVAAKGVAAQVTAIDLKPSPVSPYIILDRVTETPLAWLDPTLVQATTIQDLNTYEDTLRITYPANGPDASAIAEGRKVLTKDVDGCWQLYEIVRPEIRLADSDLIVAECEHESYELATDKLVNKLWLNGLPSQAMADVLTLGGCRWEAGTVELNNVVDETLITDLNPLAALHHIARTWGGVLRFRVEVEDGKVTGRFVDLLQRRGSYTGQRFELAHNVGDIKVDIDTKDMVTAMYGRGTGDEVDAVTGEPEPLTFRDAEWSIAEGNPADKPLGQDYVEDTEATGLYGKPDGEGGRRPIFGIYDSPEAKTPLTLLQATWTQIQRRNRPRVSIEAKLADLEGIAGFDYEKARLGDTVFVVARRGEIAVQMEATINRITRDRKDPRQTYLCLGDEVPMGSQALQALKDMAIKQDRRRRELDRGRGGQTITVASEDTSLMPWYDDFIVPSGEYASDTIIAALDKLRTVGGGRLILKEGAYSIDKSIELYGGETVEGQGPGTILTLADQSGTTIFYANAFGKPAIENITLRNMSLRGNQANNTAGSAINFENMVNVNLQYLDIREFKVWGVSIDDCEGLVLEGLTIEQKHAANTPAVSIWTSIDVLIQGLTVENDSNVECLYVVECEQVRVIGNVFRSGYSRNILFHTCPGVVISNNILKDAYTGIYLDFGEGAVVTGNEVSGCSNIGVFISRSDGATIASNVVSQSASAAIDVSESSYVDVISNQCRDSNVGIYIDNDAVKTKVSVNDLIGNTYGIVNYGTGTDTTGDNRVT